MLPLLSIVVASFALSAPAHAVQSVPYKLNFQGRLTNTSGITLSGTYDMQLKLYTASTGGTFVWGETRTAANSNPATVTNGLFSVLIGEGTAVAGSSATLQAAVTANQTLYLEVTVGAETLSPRNQLGSSAYAFNSDTLDGLDSAAFAPATGSSAYAPISGSTNYAPLSGSASYIQNGTSAQSASFNVDGSGTIGGAGVVTGNFTNNGTALFANTANSSSAFTIQTSSAAPLFVADTTNSKVYVGDPAGNSTAVLLVVDNSSQATDPVGTPGAIYYNTSASLTGFRCYETGAWRDCIGTAVSSAAATQTVANTVAETTFAQNYTIPANACIPGKVYRITARGVYGTTAAAPTLTLRVKFGTTVLAYNVNSATTTASMTNRQWTVNADVVCQTAGAAGTVLAQGALTRSTRATAAAIQELYNAAAPSSVTVNTTVAQTLQMSAQWGTANAANTITLRQFIVEAL